MTDTHSVPFSFLAFSHDSHARFVSAHSCSSAARTDIMNRSIGENIVHDNEPYNLVMIWVTLLDPVFRQTPSLDSLRGDALSVSPWWPSRLVALHGRSIMAAVNYTNSSDISGPLEIISDTDQGGLVAILTAFSLSLVLIISLPIRTYVRSTMSTYKLDDYAFLAAAVRLRGFHSIEFSLLTGL